MFDDDDDDDDSFLYIFLFEKARIYMLTCNKFDKNNDDDDDDDFSSMCKKKEVESLLNWTSFMCSSAV